MSARKNFLSIGEVSKYTGVSIDSLRYYERISLLTPSFVDPSSKYRYYSFDQIYLVYMISLCIELDIPLKDLKKYITRGERINYAGLLSTGKRIAEQKIKLLTQGVRLIDQIEEKISQTENYPDTGDIYQREVGEKYYYLQPCDHVNQTTQPFEAIKFSLELAHRDEIKEQGLYAELLEYGYLCIYHGDDTAYYMFAELTAEAARAIGHITTSLHPQSGEILHLAKNTYHCVKNKKHALPVAKEIFKDTPKDTKTYIAIETDVFSREHQINSPYRELRLGRGH